MDLKDLTEDSDSELGSSMDNLSDWARLHRPQPGSHGNQLPLKAQLSDTEKPHPQDRGEITREEEIGSEIWAAAVFNTFTAISLFHGC